MGIQDVTGMNLASAFTCSKASCEWLWSGRESWFPTVTLDLVDTDFLVLIGTGLSQFWKCPISAPYCPFFPSLRTHICFHNGGRGLFHCHIHVFGAEMAVFPSLFSFSRKKSVVGVSECYFTYYSHHLWGKWHYLHFTDKVLVSES